MGKRATTYTISNNDDLQQMVKKLNSNFRNLSKDTTIVQTTSSSGGNVKRHQDLDAASCAVASCHPQSAITNLTSDIASCAKLNALPALYATKLYPQHFVIALTTTTVPASISTDVGLTWNNIGQQTITSGTTSTTLHYFERV